MERYRGGEMFREPRIRPRAELSLSERAAGAARRARANQERILSERPDLRGYVPTDNVTNAARVLSQVPSFLAANPELLAELQAAQQAAGQDRIAMLVVRDLPLVLTDNGGSVSALAPVLSCTHSAVQEAFKRQPIVRGQYDILTSDNGLDDLVWAMAEQNTGRRRAVLDFNAKTMKPADYIALAAKTFSNETFRMRIPKKR